jgi:hypothetical protein
MRRVPSMATTARAEVIRVRGGITRSAFGISRFEPVEAG